jgi:hypothetical protein
MLDKALVKDGVFDAGRSAASAALCPVRSNGDVGYVTRKGEGVDTAGPAKATVWDACALHHRL